jgi:hypothetical protein
MNTRHLLPLLAFFSSLLVVLTVSRTPQSLFSDPAWQLKALQQHLAEKSPTLATLVQADPHDISRDSPQWISWWPIGTNLLVGPLLLTGFTIAASIRVLASLSLIAGSIGFGLWLSLFRIPRWLAISLAVGIPWIHYGNLSLFEYAAEASVFAVCPWLLVGAVRLPSRSTDHAKNHLAFLAGFGLLLGLAYWLKYSAVFISVGIVVHLALTAWKGRRWRRRWLELAIPGVIFVLTIGSLNMLNRVMGSAMNPIIEHKVFYFDWRLPFNLVGLFAMAMADADGLARYLLFHPGRALLPFSYSTLCLLGLPGGILLFYLLLRRHPRSQASLLSRDVLLTISATFIAVMTVFYGRAMEARYIAAIGIAVIPAALESAIALAPSVGRTSRAILVLAALGYLVIPVFYGAFAVIGKVARTPSGYRPGPSGIYNPLLSTTDSRSVIAALTADFNQDSDVWYLPEPLTALDLPGRVIIRHSDFLSADKLKEPFYTTRPVRVRLLLPPRFEENGKGATIRGNFPQASLWTSKAIPGMNYVEWTATLPVNQR